jgi:hypothetical protein
MIIVPEKAFDHGKAAVAKAALAENTASSVVSTALHSTKRTN